MPNKAPNFKIPSTNSKLLELKKIKSKYKVLYFYPKDNTPGCTIETKDFNSLLSQFKKLDCEVIGISKDSMDCLLYTSPSPRDKRQSRMPSSA